MTRLGRRSRTLHPPPDHGERHALHHHGTGRPRSAASPTPPSARWRIELAFFDALVGEAVADADAIRAGAEALALLDVAAALADACRKRRTSAGRRSTISLAFEIEGGRHPVVEQALRRGGRALRRQ